MAEEKQTVTADDVGSLDELLGTSDAPDAPDAPDAEDLRPKGPVVTPTTTAAARDGKENPPGMDPVRASEPVYEDDITVHDLCDEEDSTDVATMIAALSPERSAAIMVDLENIVAQLDSDKKKFRRLHTLLIPRATSRPRPTLHELNRAARRNTRGEDAKRIEDRQKLNELLGRTGKPRVARRPMIGKD